MRRPSLKSVLAQVLLAGGALAQVTTTLPYVDGDTLVISSGTNAAGVAFTSTLRTVTNGASATTSALATGLATTSTTSALLATSTTAVRTTALALTSTTTARTTTATRATTATTNTAIVTTGTTQRVGQDTALPSPMKTTTYYYDTGQGYWTVATWTASVTTVPTVATVVVPAGTPQSYAQYQTSVNSNVLASAVASASRAAGQARAVIGDGAGGILGWALMGAGAVMGAGLAL